MMIMNKFKYLIADLILISASANAVDTVTIVVSGEYTPRLNNQFKVDNL